MAIYIIEFYGLSDSDIVTAVGGTVTRPFKSLPTFLAAELSEEARLALIKYPEIKDVYKEGFAKGAAGTQYPGWGYNRTKSGTYVGKYDGSGVRVGIVDTGMAQHEDLPWPADFHDEIYGRSGNYDDHEHGTGVAGVIACQNNTVGTIGVAPGVDLYIAKSLNFSNEGTSSEIAGGIEWCMDVGCSIINLSIYMHDRWDPIVMEVCTRAFNAGIVLVASAGNGTENDFKGTNTVCGPACWESCIGVSAITSTDSLAAFSNYGEGIDICAPGKDIYSTTSKGTNGYGTWSGTSFATPFVTGHIAILMEKYGHGNGVIDNLYENTDRISSNFAAFGRGCVMAEPMPNSEAYLEITVDQAIGNTAYWTIAGLGNVWSSDYYQEACVCYDPNHGPENNLSDPSHSETVPYGVFDSVTPTSYSQWNYTEGGICTNLAYEYSYTLYGYAKAANGVWYTAGQKTFTTRAAPPPLPQVVLYAPTAKGFTWYIDKLPLAWNSSNYSEAIIGYDSTQNINGVSTKPVWTMDSSSPPYSGYNTWSQSETTDNVFVASTSYHLYAYIKKVSDGKWYPAGHAYISTTAAVPYLILGTPGSFDCYWQILDLNAFWNLTNYTKAAVTNSSVYSDNSSIRAIETPVQYGSNKFTTTGHVAGLTPNTSNTLHAHVQVPNGTWYYIGYASITTSPAPTPMTLEIYGTDAYGRIDSYDYCIWQLTNFPNYWVSTNYTKAILTYDQAYVPGPGGNATPPDHIIGELLAPDYNCTSTGFNASISGRLTEATTYNLYAFVLISGRYYEAGDATITTATRVPRLILGTPDSSGCYWLIQNLPSAWNNSTYRHAAVSNSSSYNSNSTVYKEQEAPSYGSDRSTGTVYVENLTSGTTNTLYGYLEKFNMSIQDWQWEYVGYASIVTLAPPPSLYIYNRDIGGNIYEATYCSWSVINLSAYWNPDNYSEAILSRDYVLYANTGPSGTYTRPGSIVDTVTPTYDDYYTYSYSTGGDVSDVGSLPHSTTLYLHAFLLIDNIYYKAGVKLITTAGLPIHVQATNVGTTTCNVQAEYLPLDWNSSNYSYIYIATRDNTRSVLILPPAYGGDDFTPVELLTGLPPNQTLSIYAWILKANNQVLQSEYTTITTLPLPVTLVIEGTDAYGNIATADYCQWYVTNLAYPWSSSYYTYIILTHDYQYDGTYGNSAVPIDIIGYVSPPSGGTSNTTASVQSTGGLLPANTTINLYAFALRNGYYYAAGTAQIHTAVGLPKLILGTPGAFDCYWQIQNLPYDWNTSTYRHAAVSDTSSYNGNATVYSEIDAPSSGTDRVTGTGYVVELTGGTTNTLYGYLEKFNTSIQDWQWEYVGYASILTLAPPANLYIYNRAQSGLINESDCCRWAVLDLSAPWGANHYSEVILCRDYVLYANTGSSGTSTRPGSIVDTATPYSLDGDYYRTPDFVSDSGSLPPNTIMDLYAFTKVESLYYKAGVKRIITAMPPPSLIFDDITYTTCSVGIETLPSDWNTSNYQYVQIQNNTASVFLKIDPPNYGEEDFTGWYELTNLLPGQDTTIYGFVIELDGTVISCPTEVVTTPALPIILEIVGANQYGAITKSDCCTWRLWNLPYYFSTAYYSELVLTHNWKYVAGEGGNTTDPYFTSPTDPDEPNVDQRVHVIVNNSLSSPIPSDNNVKYTPEFTSPTGSLPSNTTINLYAFMKISERWYEAGYATVTTAPTPSQAYLTIVSVTSNSCIWKVSGLAYPWTVGGLYSRVILTFDQNYTSGGTSEPSYIIDSNIPVYSSSDTSTEQFATDAASFQPSTTYIVKAFIQNNGKWYPAGSASLTTADGLPNLILSNPDSTSCDWRVQELPLAWNTDNYTSALVTSNGLRYTMTPPNSTNAERYTQAERLTSLIPNQYNEAFGYLQRAGGAYVYFGFAEILTSPIPPRLVIYGEEPDRCTWGVNYLSNSWSNSYYSILVLSSDTAYGDLLDAQGSSYDDPGYILDTRYPPSGGSSTTAGPFTTNEDTLTPGTTIGLYAFMKIDNQWYPSGYTDLAVPAEPIPILTIIGADPYGNIVTTDRCTWQITNMPHAWNDSNYSELILTHNWEYYRDLGPEGSEATPYGAGDCEMVDTKWPGSSTDKFTPEFISEAGSLDPNTTIGLYAFFRIDLKWYRGGYATITTAAIPPELELDAPSNVACYWTLTNLPLAWNQSNYLEAAVSDYTGYISDYIQPPYEGSDDSTSQGFVVGLTPNSTTTLYGYLRPTSTEVWHQVASGTVTTLSNPMTLNIIGANSYGRIATYDHCTWQVTYLIDEWDPGYYSVVVLTRDSDYAPGLEGDPNGYPSDIISSATPNSNGQHYTHEITSNPGSLPASTTLTLYAFVYMVDRWFSAGTATLTTAAAPVPIALVITELDSDRCQWRLYNLPTTWAIADYEKVILTHNWRYTTDEYGNSANPASDPVEPGVDQTIQLVDASITPLFEAGTFQFRTLEFTSSRGSLPPDTTINLYAFVCIDGMWYEAGSIGVNTPLPMSLQIIGASLTGYIESADYCKWQIWNLSREWNTSHYSEVVLTHNWEYYRDLGPEGSEATPYGVDNCELVDRREPEIGGSGDHTDEYASLAGSLYPDTTIGLYALAKIDGRWYRAGYTDPPITTARSEFAGVLSTEDHTSTSFKWRVLQLTKDWTPTNYKEACISTSNNKPSYNQDAEDAIINTLTPTNNANLDHFTEPLLVEDLETGVAHTFYGYMQYPDDTWGRLGSVTITLEPDPVIPILVVWNVLFTQCSWSIQNLAHGWDKNNYSKCCVSWSPYNPDYFPGDVIGGYITPTLDTSPYLNTPESIIVGLDPGETYTIYGYIQRGGLWYSAGEAELATIPSGVLVAEYETAHSFQWVITELAYCWNTVNYQIGCISTSTVFPGSSTGNAAIINTVTPPDSTNLDHYSTHVVVRDLEPDATYTYYGYVQYIDGTWLSIGSVSVTTLEAEPVDPDLIISYIGANGFAWYIQDLEYTWDPNHYSKCCISWSQYNPDYSPSSVIGGLIDPVSNGSYSTVEQEVSGLAVETTYTVYGYVLRGGTWLSAGSETLTTKKPGTLVTEDPTPSSFNWRIQELMFGWSTINYKKACISTSSIAPPTGAAAIVATITPTSDTNADRYTAAIAMEGLTYNVPYTFYGYVQDAEDYWLSVGSVTITLVPEPPFLVVWLVQAHRFSWNINNLAYVWSSNAYSRCCISWSSSDPSSAPNSVIGDYILPTSDFSQYYTPEELVVGLDANTDYVVYGYIEVDDTWYSVGSETIKTLEEPTPQLYINLDYVGVNSFWWLIEALSEPWNSSNYSLCTVSLSAENPDIDPDALLTGGLLPPDDTEVGYEELFYTDSGYVSGLLHSHDYTIYGYIKKDGVWISASHIHLRTKTMTIPAPFYWTGTNPKVSGDVFDITAVEWIAFLDKINEFRVYKGLSGLSWTNAVPIRWHPMTSLMFNLAREAIDDMASTGIDEKVTGDILYADDINTLVDTLNSIT